MASFILTRLQSTVPSNTLRVLGADDRPAGKVPLARASGLRVSSALLWGNLFCFSRRAA
jgi:hypothetical protein